MKIEVWDTYVSRKDGKIMHFDILVEKGKSNQEKVMNFGQAYLADKPFDMQTMNTKTCNFCHIEEAGKELEEEIGRRGYAIIEMENCS